MRGLGKETAANPFNLTPDTPDAELVSTAASALSDASIRSRALALLFERHDAAARSAIRNVFATSRLEPVDVEDILQEAHVKVVHSLGTLREPEAFRSWYCEIARRKAQSKVRALLARHHYDGEDLDPTRQEEIWEALVDGRESGEAAAVRRLDLTRLLGPALRRLPVKQLQVCLLAWVDGLSHSQIATRLGIPIGTVGSHLCRARRVLLRMLAGIGQCG